MTREVCDEFSNPIVDPLLVNTVCIQHVRLTNPSSDKSKPQVTNLN